MLPLTTRHLAILLGFVLTALGLGTLMRDQGLTLVRPYHNPRRAERVFGYLTRPTDEDVLLVGSSRVAGGLEGRLVQASLSAALGEDVSVYELGIAGLRAPFLDELLTDAIAARPPRRLLVLAIEPRFFCRVVSRVDAEGLATAAEAVAGEWSSEGRRDGLTHLLAGLEAVWNLPWSRGAALNAQAAFRHANAGEPDTPEELARTHDARHGGRNSELFDLGPDRMWQWPAPDGPEPTAFAHTLDVLDELPCEVLFVRMPLTAGFDATYMPGVSRRFLDEVVPLIEARGHRFLDLQGAPFPDADSLFLGRTHLNLRGAEITSRLLASLVLAPLLRGEEPAVDG